MDFPDIFYASSPPFPVPHLVQALLLFSEGKVWPLFPPASQRFTFSIAAPGKQSAAPQVNGL